MSQPAPPPPPAPQPGGPPRSRGKCCGGCAPLCVFVLAIVFAGSLVMLGLRRAFRTEDAGRVVVEFLEQNSKEEMKDHRRLAMSSEVLNRALKTFQIPRAQGRDDVRERDEARERLLKNMQMDVGGRFLTITVYENGQSKKEQSPVELATAVAEALHEDIVSVRQETWRRFSQNREAQTKVHMETTEKARLEWLDMMKKLDLAPAKVAAVEAEAAEMRARFAKAKADLVLQEAKLSAFKGDDAAKEPFVAERDALKAAAEVYKQQVQTGAEEAAARLSRQSEYEMAKIRYESELTVLQKLREEGLAAQVAEGVVQRPTRIVDDARSLEAPERKSHHKLQIAAAVSGILLAASLLTSLTRFLRRP